MAFPGAQCQETVFTSCARRRSHQIPPAGSQRSWPGNNSFSCCGVFATDTGLGQGWNAPAGGPRALAAAHTFLCPELGSQALRGPKPNTPRLLTSSFTSVAKSPAVPIKAMAPNHTLQTLLPLGRLSIERQPCAWRMVGKW